MTEAAQQYAVVVAAFSIWLARVTFLVLLNSHMWW